MAPDREHGDAELVDRVRAGDRAAFASLVRRYAGPLMRFARLFLRDVSMAEEAVQDTWVAVLEGLDGFEGRAALGCIPPPELPPDVEDELLRRFESWKKSRP